MLKRISIIALFLVTASGLFAKGLMDADIIFIRGYTSEVVWDASMPKYGAATFDGYWKPLDDKYWNYYKNTLLPGNRGKIFQAYWSSKDRLTTGVVKSLADRILNEIRKNGLCANKCIMITHSTGGLVTDYLLSSAWDSQGSSYDYSDIAKKTALVMHLASAGGGSELASLVRDLSFGAGCYNTITKTIAEWLFKGVSCGAGEDTIGVTNDLVPSRARTVNGSSNTLIPTLHLAGQGTAGAAGAVGSLILPGNDDSVVATHSTCGANTADGIDSCVNYMTPDGQLTSVSGPKGLYRAHYPWIMTDEDHGEMIEVQRSLDAAGHESLVTKGYGTFAESNSSSGWWIWEKSYRRITNDTSKTSGQIIKEGFNFNY